MQGYIDKVQNPMLVNCALSEKLNLIYKHLSRQDILTNLNNNNVLWAD